MKDLKRRFARIRNLMTRQRHDVRFRDEMLELAIQSISVLNSSSARFAVARECAKHLKEAEGHPATSSKRVLASR
jgi:hypothetical protein